MNHRRNRTSRHEAKRNSRKKLRGAEREAMNGHNPDTVALDWHSGKMNAEIPVVNEIPRHRKVSRKGAPKKSKCSKGGAHAWGPRFEEQHQEFYREEIHGECARCIKESKDWERYDAWHQGYFPLTYTAKSNPYAWSIKWGRCRDHGQKIYYTITTTYRTCTKCALKKRIDVNNERWNNYHRRRLTLPHREVKLY